MKKEIKRLPVDVVHAFMIDVFKAQGVIDEDARICADVLIASDLRGIESHGVGRLGYYYERIQAGIQFPENQMEIIKETDTTALVDGHHGMGHPTAYRAMKLAIKKAKALGLTQAQCFIKGPGSGRDAALRVLRASGIRISMIADVTPIPHNGCRPKKRRRV